MIKSNSKMESYYKLAGYNLLDLGCGRGGGLNFISKNYKINRGVGIDISPQ